MLISDGTSGKAVGPRLEPVAIPMGKRRVFIARQLGKYPPQTTSTLMNSC